MPRQAAYARQFSGNHFLGDAVHIYLLLRHDRAGIAVLLIGYYIIHFCGAGII
jgi:hypothetical protein